MKLLFILPVRIRQVLLVGCILFHLFTSALALSKLKVDELEIKLGEVDGLTKSSNVSPETLQKILKGVEIGNRENIYFFALMKLYGISLGQDAEIAAQNFLRASDLGHKDATTAYGVMLMCGATGKKDEITAAKYFRKAVGMGDMNAHWLLGKMLLDGKGVVRPNPAEAATLFRTAVDANVPQAEHSLALMYEYGKGVDQNFDMAAKFYRRAVEQGHVESMYNLALMYAFGRGFPQDFERARQLFETAARFEHAPSIYYIGVFKTYGYGCQVNYQQAVNWFERAASLDDYRISEKASKAAQELNKQLTAALEHNEELLNVYQKLGEGAYDE